MIRGENYYIEDNLFFVMDGGYSIDKSYRTEGVSWWPQEMLSEEEYNNAIEILKKINFHVEYIITHTAPSETVYYLSTLHNLGIKNNCTEELALTTFLDDIQRNTLYQYWYFGHFHTDLDLWRNQTAIFS